ncbi:MAG: HAMP domain-containing histidine kinase, partial [Victivallaceae bacterium]|nr:HAMP domain-containing histidine kinase [Victivallaceae bacterium]
DAKEIIGMRPGEILNCSEANNKTGGCGTSLLCSACGAVKAILKANHLDTQVEECCIQTFDGNTYNFRTWTTCPWKDRDYTLLIIRDIADEKFRNALEQTFFHDLTNTACDMQGLLSLINSPEAYKKYAHLLSNVSRELLEEINGQRDLRYAEEGTIIVKKSPIKGLSLLKDFIDLYKNQKLAEGIGLVISDDSDDITFLSDERLLRRVIENMIKNAIEASCKGQCVTAACKRDRDSVMFSLHNPNFIEKDIQLNIFKRSFSTKAQGRGWGTYSMKLLTERYLNGEIEFTSTEKDGTTFYAKYPLT